MVMKSKKEALLDDVKKYTKTEATLEDRRRALPSVHPDRAKSRGAGSLTPEGMTHLFRKFRSQSVSALSSFIRRAAESAAAASIR